jgi:dTDP-4-amino-4,6-dideoxygalactose transaminase
MLAVNDRAFAERAEIIWEKGTNRSAFYRGEVDKYGWVDIGSSFLPSEMVAAFLWAQLEALDDIQTMRKVIWERYYEGLKGWADSQGVGLPQIPGFATNNAHMFYLVGADGNQRDAILQQLRQKDILAVFYYLSLHNSAFYTHKHDGRTLRHSDRYSECLLRLPMYNSIDDAIQNAITTTIKNANN